MAMQTTLAGKGAGERPFYTEEQLRRKMRRGEEFGERAAISRPRGRWSPGMYLLVREMRALARRAGLSRTQAEALNAAADGMTLEEAAWEAGVTKQAMASRLAGARAKMARAREGYPYAGLWEIYESEVGRR